jgi:thiamine phosphate synthase YjbQ (UPF0047 family)
MTIASLTKTKKAIPKGMAFLFLRMTTASLTIDE